MQFTFIKCQGCFLILHARICSEYRCDWKTANLQYAQFFSKKRSRINIQLLCHILFLPDFSYLSLSELLFEISFGSNYFASISFCAILTVIRLQQRAVCLTIDRVPRFRPLPVKPDPVLSSLLYRSVSLTRFLSIQP
jgi:hypothetical protein